MSVLIKMVMPKACWECPLKVHLFQQLWCIPSNKVIDRDDNTKREPDCPLIEVPPHGRLIDADAFAANLKDISVRQGYKNTLIDEYLTVDDVFDSIIDELTGKAIYGFEYNPTIIEAEGSGK